MTAKCFKSLAKLFVVAVIAVVSIVPAQAQVAWVQQSICAFKVKNNTSATAYQFQLKLKGMDIWALDQQQCVSPTYGQFHVTQDWSQNELILTWSQGNTAVGQDATFAIVANHYVSLQSCDMVWADANGGVLGHIDDVWQDWTTSGSGVYGTIHNRTTGTRYVRRAIGYASNPTSLMELSTLTFPPNMIFLDPTGVSAIGAGSSSAYDYSPYYLANRSNFMFYEVYADSGATSPLVSFKTAAVTTIPAGGISFVPNVNIDNHITSSPTQLPYEMISVRAVADSYEDLRLDWIAVNSNNDSGSPTDVTVKIWKDVNNDGKVITTVDQLLGSAVLSAGSNQATVQLTPAVTIPKGSEKSFVITYTLPASVPVGSVFYAGIGDASATGITTGIRVPKTGDNIDGASIMITPPPTTIGSAKKLPVNPASGATDIVWLQDMVVTAYFGDIVYIEDANRISGIGVRLGNKQEAFREGMKVSIMGRITLDDDGSEAVLDPIDGVIGDIITPLTPLMMTNKSAGGGVFGIQPAVMDNAYTDTSAMGLSNIGKLIKICGQVTGTAEFPDGDGKTINIAWIDDGSGLQDGASEHNGVAVFMPKDWTGIPLTGMVAVTGIIRSQSSPQEKIIRVLFPRSMSDIR